MDTVTPAAPTLPMNPMDPEYKDAWLKALRSGDYAQGRGQLRQLPRLDEPGKYCCLGVAFNEFAGDDWDKQIGTDTMAMASIMSFLPREFAERLGLDFNTQQVLASRNDNGATFAEIADVIENEL